MKELWAVTFYAEGMRLEKLINEAARQGLKLHSVHREQDRRVKVCCTPTVCQTFSRLAREKGYAVTAPCQIGLYGVMRRLLRRWGMMLGLLLALLLLLMSTRFIWAIRVENAGTYQGEVRQFLAENGLHPGILRSRVDMNDIREKLEWRLPSVQWVWVEMNGMTLKIRLEPGTPPPEIQDRGEPGDVVAAEDGILLHLTVFSGTAQCKNGDPVRKGQVLIKGEERTAEGNIRPVKARGQAMARVFVSAQAQSSLRQIKTIPTGRTAVRRVLVTPFFSFSAQEEPAFLTWDEERFEIPVGGVFFPLTVRREIRQEAALEQAPRQEEDVRREAGEMALFALQKLEKSDDFVDKWVDYSMIDGGVVVATATAEILRDIARYQKSP